MKKLSLLLLSFSLYASVWAQNSFPTSNAIWNESIYLNNESIYVIDEKYETLFGLFGDTIILDYLETL
jgi:hypothetical protein